MTPEGRQRRRDAAVVGGAVYGLVAMTVRSGSRKIGLTTASSLSTLERTGPKRIGELAASQGVTQPAMTMLVARLAAAGLVERQASEVDKRAVLVSLTPYGAAHLEEARQSAADEIADVITGLTADEISALVAAVPALRHLRALEEARRLNEPGAD